MTIFIYLNVFSVLFLDLVLGLDHFCDQLEVLYILLIFTPLFSLTCMSRPTKNSVMKRHVLSPKYLEYMDFAVFLLKSNIFKVILTTGLLYCVRCLYFAETIDKFREVYPDEYRSQFNDKENSELSGNQIRHLFYGKWNALETTY